MRNGLGESLAAFRGSAGGAQDCAGVCERGMDHRFDTVTVRRRTTARSVTTPVSILLNHRLRSQSRLALVSVRNWRRGATGEFSLA